MTDRTRLIGMLQRAGFVVAVDGDGLKRMHFHDAANDADGPEVHIDHGYMGIDSVEFFFDARERLIDVVGHVEE